MIHTTNPIIKHKTGLLNLAEELSNVDLARRLDSDERRCSAGG
jgi:hypothetical protein